MTCCSGSHNGLFDQFQRKFREVDQEESYFDIDDEEPNTLVPPAVDEVAAQEGDDLRRTPRMFSLLSNGTLRMEENNSLQIKSISPNQEVDGSAATKEVPTEG